MFDNTVLTQIAWFAGPIVLTFIVWYGGKLSGMKTNITTGLIAALAALETVDLSFLPGYILAPLASGLGAAALLANTTLTERKKPPADGG